MQKVLKFSLLTLAGLGIFFGGLYVGQTKKVIIDGLDSRVVDLKADEINFDLFYEVYGHIKEKYVRPIDYSKLSESVVMGLVAGLNDPHSVYFTASEAEEFTAELAGEITGIGIEIAVKEKEVVIVAPVDGSPGQKAGLKSGDVVLAVDGVSTESLSLDEVVKKIRGEAGSLVKLVIRRGKEIKEYEIERAVIKVPAVSHKIIDSKIGYLKISVFTTGILSEVKKAADEFNAKDIKVVVLDLRDNPGGLLDEATEILDEAIDDGILVIEEEKSGLREVKKATAGGSLTKMKFVVLINKGSASASEIVAGALIDIKDAEAVGETSFGKGSVQQPFNLSNGGILKITIAHWLTPKEHQIDGKGIEPSIHVEGADEQLKRAIVEAKKLIGG